MITETLQKTVNQLSNDEKLELIKRIADSLQATKTQKRDSLKGQFSFAGITDQDISDAKQIWR